MITPADVRRTLESAGLVSGLPVEEVRDRLRTGLRLADTGQRVLAFYLNEMEVGRLYQASGHSSTAYYAEARLGLDRRRTSELIAIGKKLLELPLIDQAFCAQEIPWSNVLLLVSVAVPEHEKAWLERAKALSYRDLALDVKRSKPGSPPRKPGDRKGLPEIRFPVHAKVGTLTFQKLELAKKKLAEETGRLVNDADLLDALAEMLLQTEADGSIPGRARVDSSLYRIVLRPEGDELVAETELGPIPVEGAEELRCDAEVVRAEGSASEGPTGDDDDHDPDPKTPPWLRRRILARDDHRCRACRSSRNLMVHHIRYRSQHGPTDAKNLATLCTRCHSLVHAGLLVLVGNAHRLLFRDRDGKAIERPEVAVRDLGLARPGAPATSQTVIRSCPDVRTTETVTTVETIPAEIDGTWWRRHSHLIHGTPRGIEFEPGVAAAQSAEDSATEAKRTFDEEAFRAAFAGIVGHEPLLSRLLPEAGGSAKLGRPFPHTLLSGPPGTGKTTIARAIAGGCARRFVETSGPLLQDVHAAVRLLADLREGDVLFVDEVHAVPRGVLELLYEAMTDRRVSLTFQEPARQGARVRSARLSLPAFTLVAATTEDGDLPEPFVGRFALREVLAFHPRAALAHLVTRHAQRGGYELEPEAGMRLAEVARGTPREALRLLDRVLLDASHRGALSVDAANVNRCLERWGYDAAGLDPLQRRYVRLLRRSLRPVAAARLARFLGTSVAKLLRDVEPFLFRLGLVDVGPHGRFAVLRPSLRVSDGGAVRAG